MYNNVSENHDNLNHNNYYTEIKVAGGILGVLVAVAFGIAGYIYFKSCRKSRRRLAQSSEYHDEEMDTL